MGLTAPLTSKRYILYIYSTNIGTEYFKHALYSPFSFSSKCSLFHNANFFGSCIIHILCTGCGKIKKKYSGAKGLKDIKLHTNIRCRFTKLNFTFHAATALSNFPLLVIPPCSTNQARLAPTDQLFCPQGE